MFMQGDLVDDPAPCFFSRDWKVPLVPGMGSLVSDSHFLGMMTLIATSAVKNP